MQAAPQPDRPAMHLQTFTYRERAAFTREFDEAIDRAGGWVLSRKSLSVNALQASIEVQEHALPEVYAALIATGLELTRDSHRALAERCNCSLHLRPRPGVSTILPLHVDVHFLTQTVPLLDTWNLLSLGVATA